MIFHIQEFLHDPENGSYGDCQRAVIASLLSLPLSEVPNFNAGGPDTLEFYDRLDDFLTAHNLGRFSVAFSGTLTDVTRHMTTHYSEGQPYQVSGVSPRGFNHVVIYQGIDLLHDTHPEGGGLVGPCTDGYYWVDVLTLRLKGKP